MLVVVLAVLLLLLFLFVLMYSKRYCDSQAPF